MLEEGAAFGLPSIVWYFGGNMQHKQHFAKTSSESAMVTCTCGLQFTAAGPMSYTAAQMKLESHVGSSRQRGIDVWENEGGPCPGEPALA